MFSTANKYYIQYLSKMVQLQLPSALKLLRQGIYILWIFTRVAFIQQSGVLLISYTCLRLISLQVLRKYINLNRRDIFMNYNEYFFQFCQTIQFSWWYILVVIAYKVVEKSSTEDNIFLNSRPPWYSVEGRITQSKGEFLE